MEVRGEGLISPNSTSLNRMSGGPLASTPGPGMKSASWAEARGTADVTRTIVISFG